MNFQQIRFEAFKSQDPEMGDFDVTFLIDGKKLLAHKFMLRTISTTFSSMLSDRWTSKDQPIPIDTYSYDDFFQFLTFLYSEKCNLTNDNIAAMVDIAEFYQISALKKRCEKYFVKNIEWTTQNIVQLFDIASKYSLVKLKKSLVSHIKTSFFKSSDVLQISKDVLLLILQTNQSFISDDEEIFEKVYEWAEKQAKTKKETDPNLNVLETIKEILADFMPLFNFAEMDYRFVINFIVFKSLIPSGPELSAILSKPSHNPFPKIFVKITDESGRIMKGRFYDSDRVYADIQELPSVLCHKDGDAYFYWPRSHEEPFDISFEDVLEESNVIEWYLVYDRDDDLVARRRTEIDHEKYGDILIAEMFAEKNFVLNEECTIKAFRY